MLRCVRDSISSKWLIILKDNLNRQLVKNGNFLFLVLTKIVMLCCDIIV